MSDNFIIYSLAKQYRSIDLCTMERKELSEVGGSGGGDVFEISWEGQDYILKIVPRQMERKGVVLEDAEYKCFKLFLDKFRGCPQVAQFFSKALLVQRCGDSNYYMLERYCGDLVNIMTRSVMNQLMVAIFYLNHYLGLYHGDLITLSDSGISLRNVMYRKVVKPYSVSYDLMDSLPGVRVEFEIERFLIKIIDFGMVRKSPGRVEFQLRKNFTAEEVPIVSEVLLALYVFLASVSKNNERLHALIVRIVKHIIDQHHPSTPQAFDAYLVSYVINGDIS